MSRDEILLFGDAWSANPFISSLCLLYFFLPILMFTVNRVMLLGNVTHDPETHATKAGKMLCTIGFATDNVRKDSKGDRTTEPEYHRLVCFGPLADFSALRVKKGAPLYVEGRLHTSAWEGKKGEEMHRTEVVVDRLILLSAKHGADDVAPAGDAD